MNVCLWFIPLIAEEGRPIGDGLTWLTKNSEIEEGGHSNNPNTKVNEMKQMAYNSSSNNINNSSNYITNNNNGSGMSMNVKK